MVGLLEDDARSPRGAGPGLSLTIVRIKKACSPSKQESRIDFLFNDPLGG